MHNRNALAFEGLRGVKPDDELFERFPNEADNEVDLTRRRLEQRARDLRDSTSAAEARPGAPTPRDSVLGVLFRAMKPAEIWQFTKVPLVLVLKTLEDLEAEGVVRRVYPDGAIETYFEKII